MKNKLILFIVGILSLQMILWSSTQKVYEKKSNPPVVTVDPWEEFCLDTCEMWFDLCIELDNCSFDECNDQHTTCLNNCVLPPDDLHY